MLIEDVEEVADKEEKVEDILMNNMAKSKDTKKKRKNNPCTLFKKEEDEALIITKVKKAIVECYHYHKLGHKISDCWIKYLKKSCETGLVHEDKAKNSNKTLLIAFDKNVGNIWYLDSGASMHLNGNKNLFSKLVEADHGR